MNKKHFLYAAIFAFTLAAYGCDDKDTTGPDITLTHPENETVFTRGETISIEFDLADPSGIKEYKIDIHYAGDEHTHSHTHSVKLAEEEETPWSLQETYDDQKGKTSAHITLTPTIPANTQEGEYHLGILATDIVGNESQVYIDIDIEE